MHDFTWRLDIDLNGANGNSAYGPRMTEESFGRLNSTAMDK